MAEKKVVDFSKQKKKKTAIKILKKLRVPIALLLAVIIFFISFAAVGATRRSNLADVFKTLPSSFGDNLGYPYKEDELSLSRMLLVGDKPLVVTSTGVEVLSSTAATLLDLHLEWGDTKAISNNGRAFVFSNTSNKSYLISRTSVLDEFESDGPIITGTVNKKGCVAFANKVENAQCLVNIYSTKHVNTFAWECSEDYVSSLSLSSNGKKIVVAAIGAENAELYSRILLFKANGEDSEFDVKFPGTTILKVFYSSRNKIIAVGDNKTIILNSSGEQIDEIPYSDDSLFAVDSDKNGNVLLCYKEFGGSKVKIVRIPKSGKSNKSFDIDYLPDCVDLSSNRVLAAVDNEVSLYSFGGVVKKSYDCDGYVSEAYVTSNGIYTVENGTICKY